MYKETNQLQPFSLPANWLLRARSARSHASSAPDGSLIFYQSMDYDDDSLSPSSHRRCWIIHFYSIMLSDKWPVKRRGPLRKPSEYFQFISVPTTHSVDRFSFFLSSAHNGPSGGRIFLSSFLDFISSSSSSFFSFLCVIFHCE